ncbi:MAG: restriction endonuclease subunit S, partial [Bacteroidota bacterium]
MSLKAEKLKKKVPELRFPGFEGEWEEKRLGEIGRFVSGIGFPREEQGGNEGIPFYKVSDMNLSGNESEMHVANNFVSKDQIKENRYKVIEGPSIIFAKVGAAIFLDRKRIAQIFLIDNNMMAFTPKKHIVYLKYVFDRIRLAQYAQVGALPSYNQSDLSIIKVQLPQEEEQKKIADFFGTVDEWIENLKAQKGKWEEYKKGMMQKIFSQEIRFKDEDGNEFPEWEEKRLGEVGRIVTGKTPSTTDKTLWCGDILFVTPTDIANGEKYQRQTARKVEVSDRKKILPSGSILYTCIASIGKMSLSTAPSISNQQINALITDEKSDNEFVYYALLNETPRIKAIQANTTLPIINKTEFSMIRIELPALEEQQKIAAFLT